MARRKKLVTTRDTKIRLPEEVAQDLEKISKETGAPMNRIIIDRLASYDGHAIDGGKLAERLRDLEILLARYGARLGSLELSEQLLAAVDGLLKAESSAAAIDKLRAARAVMLKREQDDRKLIEKLEK
jgi:hypothetical protein